jgi:putative Mn2+ efflux pump MntP
VQWHRCLKLGAIGAAAALALVLVAIWSSPPPDPGETEGGYVSLYRPPADRFETLLNRADGQAYAALAQDPSMERADVFDGGPRIAAYWMARPGLPYALFTLSAGRPALIPAAFVIVETVAGGLLVLGAAAVLHRTGRAERDRWAFATLALPGAQLGLVWLGQDVLATGLALPRITPRHVFRLSFHFGLFQFMMPVIGWLAGRTVSSYISAYDHWVACGLLSFIGGKMLWEAFFDHESEKKDDPTRGLLLVTLSIATSLDALAVGLSLAFLDVSIWVPSLVIGLVAGILTMVGIRFGGRIGERFEKWADVAGGLVLIGIGLEILISHLA